MMLKFWQWNSICRKSCRCYNKLVHGDSGVFCECFICMLQVVISCKWMLQFGCPLSVFRSLSSCKPKFKGFSLSSSGFFCVPLNAAVASSVVSEAGSFGLVVVFAPFSRLEIFAPPLPAASSWKSADRQLYKPGNYNPEYTMSSTRYSSIRKEWQAAENLAAIQIHIVIQYWEKAVRLGRAFNQFREVMEWLLLSMDFTCAIFSLALVM